MTDSIDWTAILIAIFIATQVAYLLQFLIEGYFFTRPVNRVEIPKDGWPADQQLPFVYLLYPVLDEREETMRTTFEALARLAYPRHRFRVVAIPNLDDEPTRAALQRMGEDFGFLEIMPVPPTHDASWNLVWRQWDANPHCYWWHGGNRERTRDLPPKKTRQLIWAFYNIAAEHEDEDFLVNYIDADSAPPADHFLCGAYGMRQYDVLQSTNIAGNLLATLPASLHAFDHMAWDGRKYGHMSADGKHPYWVLGKGLFFRASDLLELGGFNPWITIEDPEVGMRFWKNGRRLGIIEAPLIEEVPATFRQGITQRKRWVAGFWQSLGAPLDAMGFTRSEKFKAWLNFIPCLSLGINLLGLPVGAWALVTLIQGEGVLPRWTLVLAAVNVVLYLVSMATLYWSTWRRTAIVLSRRRDRLAYLLRVNPVFIWIWWLVWQAPLWIGWRMYRRDHGLEWERTEKIDANAELVREHAKRHDFSEPAVPLDKARRA